MDFDQAEFLKGVASIIRDSVTPLQAENASLRKQIEELKARPVEKGDSGAPGPAPTDEQIAKAVAAYLMANPPEKGEKGESGRDGADGRDAEPIEISDVVRELLVAPELSTLVTLHVSEGVEKHFEANPVQHGKDGRAGADGKDGTPGQKGDPGEDGAIGPEGLGLKDLFRAEGGRLMAVLSNGETRDLGEFVGKDGKDGLSVENLSREYDAESHEMVERWSQAGVTKEVRYPAGGIRHGGYWREGTKAMAGQTWTHAGAAWIAKRETSQKPSRDSSDWEIFANKGRDGVDGRQGRDLGPPEPVKV